MRTQDATNEIRSMIERLRSNTGSAVAAMQNSKAISEDTVCKAKHSGEVLHAISCDVEEISEVNTQVAAAAEEQSAVTEEIRSNMEAINELVILTSGNEEKTASASDNLTLITDEIRQLVDHYQVSGENELIGEYQRIA